MRGSECTVVTSSPPTDLAVCEPVGTGISSSSTLGMLAALSSHDGLILASDAGRVGLQRELRLEFERRTVIRLRRGVYVLTAEWAALGADERYLRQIRAHAAVAESHAVYSHFSAAALWGLPIVGAWPSEIHLTASAAAAAAAATAVAMARMLPFGRAVAVMDKAIHEPRNGAALTTRAELERELAQLGRVPGRAAAGRVLEFATPLSGSAGESISRAGIFLLGFLAPDLQVPHWDRAGLIGYSDFFWPGIRSVGEFDGHGKYLRDEFTGGRPAADVVIAEKVREDRLRALGLGVFRWDWPVASSLPAMGELLTRNGIPRAR